MSSHDGKRSQGSFGGGLPVKGKRLEKGTVGNKLKKKYPLLFY